MRPPASLERLRRDRGAMTGAALVALLLMFALAGPACSSHDPWTSDFARGVSPSGGPVGPCRDFLLGADRIFRDELARLAYGARLSLFIAVCATTLSTALGTTVGVVSGFVGGKVDFVLMRLLDVGMAFPFILLVMAVGASLGQTTPVTILLVLGLTGWLGAARIVRAKAMSLRSADFVLASRALGQSTPGILVRHVLPNVAGPVTVLATLSVAQMILAESVLGYLGAGVAPPMPTWGHMVLEGQDYLAVAPWTFLAPATAILVAVLAFNLLGEGVRRAIDPAGSEER